MAVLGSTGSIGTNCLKIFDFSPEFALHFQIYALTTHQNIVLLREQILKYKPQVVVITDESKHSEFLANHAHFFNDVNLKKIKILKGANALVELVQDESVNVILNALVGISGLLPTYYSILNSKFMAIANKETIVVAGQLFKRMLKENPKSSLIPIDSEHSALFFLLKCFNDNKHGEIEKIILTASGGALHGWTDLSQVQLEDVLKHPNWNMGKKITIDSASLMNKGFELIEAYNLFTFKPDQIEVVIHPQSYIHALVKTKQSTYYAQISYPDMILPIQNAISYPNSYNNSIFKEPQWDIFQFPAFEFQKVDNKKYPLLNICYQILKMETYPSYCVVLNAVNDVAVEAFLKNKIHFTDISKIIQISLDAHKPLNNLDLEAIILLDQEIRSKLKEDFH